MKFLLLTIFIALAQCQYPPGSFMAILTTAKAALKGVVDYHQYVEVILKNGPLTRATLDPEIQYIFYPSFEGSTGIPATEALYDRRIFLNASSLSANDSYRFLYEDLEVSYYNETTGEVSGSVHTSVFANITFFRRDDAFVPGYNPDEPQLVKAHWLQRSTVRNNKLLTEILEYDLLSLYFQLDIEDKCHYLKKYFKGVSGDKTWNKIFDRYSTTGLNYRTSFPAYHP